MTEFSFIYKSKSMDWFLYDRDLRHERVQKILDRGLNTPFLKSKVFFH